MNKDQAIGALILVASIIGIIVYGWLLYLYSTIVLQLTAFLAVAFILGILAWIGYVMATTPPPPPLELETPAAPPEQAPPTPSSAPSQPETKPEG